MIRPRLLAAACIASLTIAFVYAARSADPITSLEYVITLKDHAFTPQNLEVPADTPVTIWVENQQSAPAEFESSALKREKVVPANDKISFVVGPLKAGTYNYVDDFHEETKGTITATPYHAK